MHLSIVTHSRLIGDYHAQHPFVAYTLHNRAGTLASLLYKAEKPSVRPSVTPLTQSSLHGSMWDLASVEVWFLACERMFKQVFDNSLLVTRALQKCSCRSFSHHFQSCKV